MTLSTIDFLNYFNKKTMRYLCIILPLMYTDINHAADPFDPDKTWSILGSTYGRLFNFESLVLDDPNSFINFPAPDGTALYTNLEYIPDSSEISPLAGLYQTHNFGDGRRTALSQLNIFDGALSVGLFLRDQRECGRNIPLRALTGDETIAEAFGQDVLDIYASHLDEMIDFFITTGRDVLLRIGDNFDDPELCYTPEEYIAAFRAIKQRIDEKGATNIYTVWTSAADPFLAPPFLFPSEELEDTFGEDAIAFESFREDHLERWYPGDEFVDVIGFPYYHGEEYQAFAYPALGCEGEREEPYTLPLTFRDMQNRVLDFAKAHEKPAMITEAAPLGVDLLERTIKCQFRTEAGLANLNALPSQPILINDIWNLWYEGYFNFIRENTDIIKAASYKIHAWSLLPFNAESFAYRGNSELSLNRDIQSRFLQKMRASHFLNRPQGSGVRSSFETPDGRLVMETPDGRLEAEHAQSFMFRNQGDFEFVPNQQNRVALAGASNSSVHNLSVDGAVITYLLGVTAGNQIFIRYAPTALTSPNNENGEPFTFSVIIDEEVTTEVPFTNTFTEIDNEFIEVTVDTNVNDGSRIEIRLDSGSNINFDYIRIENSGEGNSEANNEENTDGNSAASTEANEEGATENADTNDEGSTESNNE